MTSLEVIGYVASGAVFVTFWMKTMISLRILGIASNVLFFSYGLYGELYPIVILHGSLFPLNISRLVQAVKLRQRIHEMAHSDFDVKTLIPFMQEHRLPKGAFLFKKGDLAHNIYYLEQGAAKVIELNIELKPGTLVGEIAIFSPDKVRTQTVKCEADCVLFKISKEKVFQIYSENPEFGLYLIKMIITRLLFNSTERPRLNSEIPPSTLPDEVVRAEYEGRGIACN